MDRIEYIEKINKIQFCAIPTVITEDMGMQYDYISPEGCGTGFGGMGRWPLFCFNKIEGEKWQHIREKASSGKLSMDDLAGTDLEAFGDDLLNTYYGGCFRDISIEDMMTGLGELPEHLETDFFCIFDLGDSGYENHKPEFYGSKEECISCFRSIYCDYIEKWEDMDIDELEEWMERIQEGEFPEEVPFNRYNMEDE